MSLTFYINEWLFLLHTTVYVKENTIAIHSTHDDMNYRWLLVHLSYTLTLYMQKNHGKPQDGLVVSLLNSLKNPIERE